MKSPLIYYGGKTHLVKKILGLIPPHKVYVEVFGGSAKLLFAKPPSPKEIYNDIDPYLANFFRVFGDKRLFPEFYRKVLLTPYSREEHLFCYETYQQVQSDPLECAYRYYIANRQSFNGRFRWWSYIVDTSSWGMASSCGSWLAIIEELPQLHKRFQNVEVQNLDFRLIIQNFNSPEVFMYLDPPYVKETRKTRNVYAFEMDLADHEDLVNLLLTCSAKIILSGYEHEVYKPLEANGWRKLEFYVPCYAVGYVRSYKGGGEVRCKECLWLSPNISL